MGSDEESSGLRELVRQAYKKLKSYAYYDKNLASLKRRILDFEKEAHFDVDSCLDQFTDELINNLERNKPLHEPTVNFEVFPKKLQDRKSNNIITNNPERRSVSRLQFFIDLDVCSNILGVLWCMTAGFEVDRTLSDNAYGNRINTNTARSHSPFLFMHYPIQYSTWRDKSIEKVESFLKDGQDVAYVTADIRRFFYNIDFDDTIRERLLQELNEFEYPGKLGTDLLVELYPKLTEHVFSVLDGYRKATGFDKTVMPIGYPPSNILSNYYMREFDRDVCIKARPDYYGRYVDDMVFVIRIEKENPVTEGCPVDFIINRLPGLFQDAKLSNYSEDQQVRIINEGLPINMTKTRVFVFDSDHPDTSLAVLKKNIDKNSSEFRYIPDQEFFDDELFSIFKGYSEDCHKPSELAAAEIDRYGLSKFLGKYQRITSIFEDEQLLDMFRTILKNLNDDAIVENYSLWERLLQIAIQTGSLAEYQALVDRISDVIDKTEFCPEKDFPLPGIGSDRVSFKLRDLMRGCLHRYLNVSIARSLATRWGPGIAAMLKSDKFGSTPEYRVLFCLSRMCDKQALAVPVDGFIRKTIDKGSDSSQDMYELRLNDSHDLDLSSFESYFDENFEMDMEIMSDYGYYPYIIKMQDLCIYNLIWSISTDGADFNASSKILNEQYGTINYNLKKEDPTHVFDSKEIDRGICVRVGDKRYNRLSVAVSNTGYPSEESIRDFFLDRKGISKKIPHEARQIINESIKNDVDMVVMPECFLPCNLISYFVNFCSKNDLCLITGLQYIMYKGSVYNFSMSALPYEDQFGQRGSILVFHLKNHYAPKEKEHIASVDKKAECGNGYELICWNNVWFSICCCYELASIDERALFKYIVDMKAMVEFNKDVNYFSNIIESLSRDIHCYCVQVNNSYYGDSRITGPFKSETKDLIKVKGGRNSTILYEVLDIDGLRNYQIDGFDRNDFKQIPPGFDRDIPKMKQNGTLFDNLERFVGKKRS